MQLAPTTPSMPVQKTAPPPVAGAPASPKVGPITHVVTDEPTARDAEGRLVPVEVGMDPEARLETLTRFYHRNPGWLKTGPVADALRGALDELPGVGGFVRDLTEPSDVGYGQGIRDQTRWQIDSHRQPDNDWWLRMNKQLVQDPMTAERAVRTGTTDALDTPGQKAWAEYIRRSDLVTRAMGLDPDAAAAAAERGEPIALSDTWKGVSIAKRAYVQHVLKPYARKALWVAHRKTLEDGRKLATVEAETMHRRAPREMEFSSAWATLIGYYSYLSPPITGHQSKIAQRVILPLDHPIDPVNLPWSKKAFAKFADWLDPVYEREIARPTDAKDAAALA
ncbi:MAG: hypothetical protein JWM86_2547 [Thermoleophilia bacterium]|nr:hypothetical protein [Thermoleophilia bacterium]